MEQCCCVGWIYISTGITKQSRNKIQAAAQKERRRETTATTTTTTRGVRESHERGVENRVKDPCKVAWGMTMMEFDADDGSSS